MISYNDPVYIGKTAKEMLLANDIHLRAFNKVRVESVSIYKLYILDRFVNIIYINTYIRNVYMYIYTLNMIYTGSE